MFHGVKICLVLVQLVLVKGGNEKYQKSHIHFFFFSSQWMTSNFSPHASYSKGLYSDGFLDAKIHLKQETGVGSTEMWLYHGHSGAPGTDAVVSVGRYPNISMMWCSLDCSRASKKAT